MQLHFHLCKIVAMTGNNNKENGSGQLLAPLGPIFLTFLIEYKAAQVSFSKSVLL